MQLSIPYTDPYPQTFHLLMFQPSGELIQLCLALLLSFLYRKCTVIYAMQFYFVSYQLSCNMLMQIRFLAIAGGDNVGQITRRIMKKLMSDSVALFLQLPWKRLEAKFWSATTENNCLWYIQ